MTTEQILNALLENDELFTRWAENKIDSKDVVKKLTEPKTRTYRVQFEVEFITAKEVSELMIEQFILKGVMWSLDVKGVAAPKDVKVKLINT